MRNLLWTMDLRRNRIAILLLAGIAVPILASAQTGTATGTMNDAERAYLVEQLEATKKNMLESIAGLTPAQWTFKAGPDRWSIAQCAEHIVLAEGFLFGASQGILLSPAVPRPVKSNADVDKALVAGVQDRSNKRKAPEPIVPTGKFTTPDAAAAAFIEARDKSIAYVKTTNDALRVHVGDGPAGPIDVYQMLLLMAAHSARHTAQIVEVKASADYPAAQ